MSANSELMITPLFCITSSFYAAATKVEIFCRATLKDQRQPSCFV